MKIYTLNKALLKNKIEEILNIDRSQMKSDAWAKVNFFYDLPSKFDLSVIVLEKERVLGFSIVSKKEKRCHLHRIMVAKKLTGQGIGSQMINEVVKRAKKANLKKLTVQSQKKARVENFYLKNGFKKLDKVAQKVYSLGKKPKGRAEFIKNYFVFVKDI